MNQTDLFGRVPTRVSRRGMERKKAGQARALENEAPAWRVAALVLLEKYCDTLRVQSRGAHARPAEFVFEEFRVFALSRGLPHPHAHQCWGALAMAARKAKLIKGTGRYRGAQSVRTHGHPVEVLEVCA